MPQPSTNFTFVLEIRDPDGDVCANGAADVPCIVSISTYPAGSEAAVLSGTLTKTPVAGVLTFDDLQIDLEGEGYVLRVEAVDQIDEDNSLVAKFSDAFDVVPSYSLDAVVSGDFIGFNNSGGYGAISPATYNGQSIAALETHALMVGIYPITMIVLSGDLAQSFFTTLTINGSPLLSSGANEFAAGGGSTQWVWYNTSLIPSAGTYIVLIE